MPSTAPGFAILKTVAERTAKGEAADHERLLSEKHGADVRAGG